MSLTLEQCPLVGEKNEAVIDRYNDLTALVERIRSELPQAVWRELSQSAAERSGPGPSERQRRTEAPQRPNVEVQLQRLYQSLTRPTYPVGFMGRSGLGKSTTINKILIEALGCNLLKEGQCRACTSAVTRIRFVAPGQPALMVRRYMKEEQYRCRRNAYAVTLGLVEAGSEDTKSDTQLIQELEPLVRSSDTDESKENQVYFYALLCSRRDCGQEWLGHADLSQPFKNVEELAREAEKYTAHGGSQQASPDLLLQEVELAVPVAGFSSLELLDLPGLGAAFKPDEELTKTYLGTLEGALVFQPAQQVEGREALELLQVLRPNFRSLRGRLWMVISCFDALDSHLVQGDYRTTVFSTIDEMLRKWNVPPEQTLFVSNRVYNKADARGKATLLNLDFDNHKNAPIMPTAASEYPAGHPVKEAYGALMQDGGIQRIREAVKTTVAREVRRRVIHDVKDLMGDVTDRLIQAVEARRDALGYDNVANLTGCAQLVGTLAHTLDGDREVLGKPSSDLRTALRETLNTMFGGSAFPNASRAFIDMRRFHASVANALAREARNRVSGDKGTVWQVYRNLAHRLEGLAGGLDGAGNHRAEGRRLAELPKTLNPALQLQEDRWKDRDDTSLTQEDLDSIGSNELFEDANPGDVSPADYCGIMKDKVDLIVYQILQRIQNRAKGRLEEMMVKLLDAGGSEDNRPASTAERPTDGEPAAREQAFDEILAALHDLREQLKQLTVAD
jgi:hypothetical protein